MGGKETGEVGEAEERGSVAQSFSQEPLTEALPPLTARLTAWIQPIPKRYILSIAAMFGFCKILGVILLQNSNLCYSCFNIIVKRAWFFSAAADGGLPLSCGLISQALT